MNLLKVWRRDAPGVRVMILLSAFALMLIVTTMAALFTIPKTRDVVADQLRQRGFSVVNVNTGDPVTASVRTTDGRLVEVQVIMDEDGRYNGFVLCRVVPPDVKLDTRQNPCISPAGRT